MLCTLATGVFAQRSVIINGTLLNAAQIRQLEQVACAPIPDGAYWLNMQSGAWGYAGNPAVMGHVGDACQRSQRRKSLSERGLLFSPGELMR